MNKSSIIGLYVVGGIIVILLATVILIGSCHKSKDGGDNPPPKFETSGDSVKTSEPVTNNNKRPPKVETLNSGETRTSTELKGKKLSVNVPSREADNARIQATYIPGKTYINLLKGSMTSRSSYKDWGVVTVSTFNYGLEYQISRYIVSNNGKELEAIIQVDRAQAISVFTKIEDMHLELGLQFQSLLELGGYLLGSDLWTRVPIESGNQILNNDFTKAYFDRLVSDESAKLFSYVDSLRGKKARVVFENGKGIKTITPIDCTLSQDEQLFFANISILADIFMMEKLECKPGDRWEIRGEDLVPIIDPSLRGKCGGSVSVVRGKDIDGVSGKEALLEIKGGTLTMDDYDQEQNKSLGRWSPAGQMVFSFDEKIITEADLSGNISYETKSTNHILFEMHNVVTPKYTIKYSAWLADGDKLKETPKLTRPVQEGTLDALKKKLSR